MENSANTDQAIDSTKFWIHVRNIKNSKGENPYKKLAEFALRAFSFSISNAVVERVFSIMNVVRSKVRNRLSFAMLESILRIRLHLKVLNKCCDSYNPSEKILSLLNSDMYKNEEALVEATEFEDSLNILNSYC